MVDQINRIGMNILKTMESPIVIRAVIWKGQNIINQTIKNTNERIIDTLLKKNMEKLKPPPEKKENKEKYEGFFMCPIHGNYLVTFEETGKRMFCTETWHEVNPDEAIIIVGKNRGYVL